MSILKDFEWKSKYSPNDGNLLNLFYIPVLSCAVRYDRTTGFFSADALAKAAVGVEELVRNKGHMRLIVGCTLDYDEVCAINRGESLRKTVEANLQKCPFDASSNEVHDSLELLAWMVANEYLDVRVAVPLNQELGTPAPNDTLFHEKSGLIEDKTGERLVFHGSLNETLAGWTKNWESFHVYTSWRYDARHLNDEEESFHRLWANRDSAAEVLDLPTALRKKLLSFKPERDALPKRLHVEEPEKPEEEPTIVEPEAETAILEESAEDKRQKVWSFIQNAPSVSGGGDYIGEATSAITPWPHQVHAFDRMYRSWPPRLLIADEVGLGKTIEAGLLIRQAWISGKAKRILILAPKAVLRQWQIELREKFNLNVPIYDGGHLHWYPSPAMHTIKKEVSNTDWHKEPFLLVSSNLMQRRERSTQLINEAEPWDLLILDEAHHARRRSFKAEQQTDNPNRLLRLMRSLKEKTQGLILLTATPMQVHPIEVWDLLNLLGMPAAWNASAFLKFFELSALESPTEEQFSYMANLFRVMESQYREMTIEEAVKYDPDHAKPKVRNILKAIRSPSSLLFKNMDTKKRQLALLLMKSFNPTRMLISRHTRELLRRYHEAGKIQTNIATRIVDDYEITLTDKERDLYEEVEDYISSTYNKCSVENRTAIGFVMTIYRRRLASSFDALEATLQNRLDDIQHKKKIVQKFLEEDFSQDELQEDATEPEDVERLENQALQAEEEERIQELLYSKRHLPKTDSKAQGLMEVLTKLRSEGYQQVIIFTQFTDTLDSLRKTLAHLVGQSSILCFSGRGGEQWANEEWQPISREKTKELFRQGRADILLCTDAAAEGLNLQACGALINYDMPWNPMKVEQRIGRIDRLGQKFSQIKIINLMYADTVETDVYKALKERIGLFSSFIGRLQPILSTLPKDFEELVLQDRKDRLERAGEALVSEITTKIEEKQKESGFDLDEIRPEDLEMSDRPDPSYDLSFLHKVLTDPDLLPPGYIVKPNAGGKDFSYLIPGQKEYIRVTTDTEYYEQHPESVELWSPGSPAFPKEY